MRTKDAPATYKVAGDSGAPSGEFEALVSVFGNVDYVGDRVQPGAFTKSLERWADSGNAIPVVYSHAHSDPMALLGGVVAAEERDAGLWVKGQLDMELPAAAAVQRHMANRRLTKFSFAYDVLDGKPNDQGGDDLAELDVIEVGPTLVPANPATDLLAVKRQLLVPAKAGRVLSAKNEERLRQARDLLGEVLDQLGTEDDAAKALQQLVRDAIDRVHSKGAIPSHSTATTTGTWDGNTVMGRLDSAAGYRAACAWVDPEADPNTRAAYRFPHHTVSDTGSVGAANLSACSAGIGILNGGRGGTAIPAADRQGVWNHLARHLRDGDQEPPPLGGSASAADTQYLSRALAMAVGGIPTGR